ncbi:bifunctional glycosyltransferase family 2/GtrA family protein [Glutamicibacter sp. M10]|uniref:bifunctional glycosyltransferase family 2/GtrA family protein n=1 Tax=Glutamicibacter sp. M10 TaxID=3023076 RepID=UPI0021C9A4A2|nr:bifunctional glycosyltransferase family 2/GtrA family protein [Glutamicibacter sp. M10]UXN31180.1 bifunctional glycosyltransferase family 2/GtrA family protein [Glutamicibacter sp. M10]
MILLIPAFEPDEKLNTLIESLQLTSNETVLVVVDDGSGPTSAEIFAYAQRQGAILVQHPVNLGKGAALKTGFSFIAENFPGHDVVTADCDGQHAAEDIYAVAREVGQKKSIVLGEREFSGKVPLRSKLGNKATALFFALSTGTWLNDTQTGLRGFPAEILPWLGKVPGERYEYELNMLLDALRNNIELQRVKIQTIYLNDNESSHFRPIRDSIRIYAPLLKFSASSLAGFAVDTVLLLIFTATFHQLLPAVVLARLGSAAVNFWINRQLVFTEGRTLPLRATVSRYALLAIVLLALNYELLTLLSSSGIPLLLGKIITEIVLFLVSFSVQKRFLFRKKSSKSSPFQHSQARHLVNTESPQGTIER